MGFCPHTMLIGSDCYHMVAAICAVSMAAVGCELSSSNENQYNQLKNNLFEVQSKYKQYLEYDKDSNKVKWKDNLENLKCFAAELFGDEGKWISPGGNAKSFRFNQISITWYPHKKSLIIHRDVGCKLNDLLIDLCMNKVVGNVTKRYDDITPNIALEETNITNILDVMRQKHSSNRLNQ